MNSSLEIQVFTDPFCPYAYSAEPTRLRLLWLYGNRIIWHEHVIVLSGFNNETSPVMPDKSAQFKAMLEQKYKMPMVTSVADRQQVTLLACKAFVAVREHSVSQSDAFLRNLRVAALSNKTLDTQLGIDEIAERSNINTTELMEWMSDEATQSSLNEDAEAARQPGAFADAFTRKLSQTSTGKTRYSAPSYRFIQNGSTVGELPGFWPLEAYEAVIGNVAPALTRREDPSSVEEILEWANMPLATVEVATIAARPIEDVRSELAETKATFAPLGSDGFWSL